MQSDIDTSLIRDDTPLRPAVAAKVAFPDGSMTEKMLRGFIRSGALEVETFGNKQYVTVAGIAEMRRKLRERQ